MIVIKCFSANQNQQFYMKYSINIDAESLPRSNTSSHVLPKKVTCIQLKKSFSMTFHMSFSCFFFFKSFHTELSHFLRRQEGFESEIKKQQQVFPSYSFLQGSLHDKVSVPLIQASYDNLQNNWKWYKHCPVFFSFCFLMCITCLENFNRRNCPSLKWTLNPLPKCVFCQVWL